MRRLHGSREDDVAEGIPAIWNLDAVHELLRRANCDEGVAVAIFEAGKELFDGGSVIAHVDPDAEARDALMAELSPRERDVVDLLSAGLRLSAIAARLFISNHTARNHLKHVFRKTGTHSQVELLSRLGGRRG